MKRLFCLLISIMIFIPLTACRTHNSNLDTIESETTDNTIADSSNFEPIDLSYENVAKLTDFKCYVSFREKSFTINGSRAKDLYNIVHENTNEALDTPSFSDKNYVYLVFYNNKEDYPSENISANNYYGIYAIYEDGVLEFSGSPYHSAIFEYKTEPNLYNLVVDNISVEN